MGIEWKIILLKKIKRITLTNCEVLVCAQSQKEQTCIFNINAFVIICFFAKSNHGQHMEKFKMQLVAFWYGYLPQIWSMQPLSMYLLLLNFTLRKIICHLNCHVICMTSKSVGNLILGDKRRLACIQGQQKYSCQLGFLKCFCLIYNICLLISTSSILLVQQC